MSQAEKIFTSDKKYIYKAIYTNKDGDTLSNEIVSIQATGEMWAESPNQFEAIFRYENEGTDLSVFLPTAHKEEMSLESQETKEVIENEYSLWMHPFRANQYCITEIAPFPSCSKRYRIGDQWKVMLKIGKGWGHFKGRSRRKGRVIAQENVVLNNLRFDNCMKIKALAKHRLGKSTLDYRVYPDNGFIKMDYSFFNSHKLVFEIIRIERI